MKGLQVWPDPNVFFVINIQLFHQLSFGGPYQNLQNASIIQIYTKRILYFVSMLPNSSDFLILKSWFGLEYLKSVLPLYLVLQKELNFKAPLCRTLNGMENKLLPRNCMKVLHANAQFIYILQICALFCLIFYVV